MSARSEVLHELADSLRALDYTDIPTGELELLAAMCKSFVDRGFTLIEKPDLRVVQ